MIQAGVVLLQAFSVRSWCALPVTRRRTILIASVALFFVIAVAALTMPACVVSAEASCSSGCKAAYGSCYKKSQDRSKCQAQLQRCLESCIKSKR